MKHLAHTVFRIRSLYGIFKLTIALYDENNDCYTEESVNLWTAGWYENRRYCRFTQPVHMQAQILQQMPHLRLRQQTPSGFCT